MRKSGISGAALAVALAVGLGAGEAACAGQERQEAPGDPERRAPMEEVATKAEQAVAAQKALAAQRETERLIREQEAETRRLAEEQRREAARAKAIERERSCVIRPVMADAEIDRCRWAWSVPPPG